MKPLVFIILAALTFGCSSGDQGTTVTGPDGKDMNVKVDKDGGGMKVEGNGVQAQVGGDLKVTDTDARAPFYPGATVDSGRSMKVKTEKEESVLVYLSSTDDVGMIKAFYEEKLAGIKFNEFKNGEAINYIGETKSSDGGKVAIAIVKKSASEPAEISIGYGKENK